VTRPADKAPPAIVEASFLCGATAIDQLPAPALAEVAFAGRSNVGKSSLLNALVGRKGLVRAGREPGTTRQLNLFSARAVDGLEVVFVDLPGYGFAKRSKHEKKSWGPLIEGYLGKRVSLRALVLLVDVRRGPEREEKELLEFVRALETAKDGRPARPPLGVIVVATKTDKLAGSARKPAVERVGRELGCRAYGFSAMTGEGKDELWRALRRAIAGA
jgi:GTP-binding protein